MRARLVENINFERTKNPRAGLDIGGISLGKSRYEKKKENESEWFQWLKDLLEGKKVSGKFKHIYTHTPDGMVFDGDDKWQDTTINIVSVMDMKDPWDAHHIPIEDTERRVWAIPIDDKKIFIEGKINENQNFERGGVNEPSDLGLGKWKETDEIVVPFYEFEKNGGVLKKGRDVWILKNGEYQQIGEYLDYDENQEVHLISSPGWKTWPAPPGAGVKVRTKILYQ